jgi:hypothetical protein
MNKTILLAAALPLALGACAGTRGPTVPDDIDQPPTADYRGVPGFDIRDYPGDGVMARWREASPYRWVGFYLTAPCYTGTSWGSKRLTLEGQGWAMAVLYVGEQDWNAMGGAQSAPTQPADSLGAPRCTTTNLTEDNGRAHAVDAALRAQTAGFLPGTVLYLDVERVEQVSSDLATYVGAWIGGLLDDRRYLPGLYVHGRNADALMAIAAAEYEERARFGTPRLWVASTEGFDVAANPSESGIPTTTIWQGALDVERHWGDVTLRIDENVAAPGLPGLYVPGRLDPER